MPSGHEVGRGRFNVWALTGGNPEEAGSEWVSLGAFVSPCCYSIACATARCITLHGMEAGDHILLVRSDPSGRHVCLTEYHGTITSEQAQQVMPKLDPSDPRGDCTGAE